VKEPYQITRKDTLCFKPLSIADRVGYKIFLDTYPLIDIYWIRFIDGVRIYVQESGPPVERITERQRKQQAADSYGDIAICMDALFDLAIAGSDGALEALKSLATAASNEAVKWSA
jgi:hypothetical protein